MHKKFQRRKIPGKSPAGLVVAREAYESGGFVQRVSPWFHGDSNPGISTLVCVLVQRSKGWEGFFMFFHL